MLWTRHGVAFPAEDAKIMSLEPTQATEDANFLRLIFVENWFEELKARVPVP